MTLRRISRWERPWESAGYMFTYFVFLFYSYITRAFVSRCLASSSAQMLKQFLALVRFVHRHQTQILSAYYSRATRGSEGRRGQRNHSP